ncbi:hypothetical protein P171DRAFT_53793 [Karstenula rhodostoma CBS 690.94]|uniref:Uncharacterized protein n=1 Tax=Karstenula rhodostoma CBS 690.94 TaxID=1392251 RepID=A0A9P4PGZ6_9PLEO|nr:hypothetical protein P171DRAFT_53793 [Karstenula rhodostoma CBS 690.94]
MWPSRRGWSWWAPLQGVVVAMHAAYREGFFIYCYSSCPGLKSSSDSPPLTWSSTRASWLLCTLHRPIALFPAIRNTVQPSPASLVSALHGIAKRGLANHPGQPRKSHSAVWRLDRNPRVLGALASYCRPAAPCSRPDSALHETPHPPQLAPSEPATRPARDLPAHLQFPSPPASSPWLPKSPQNSTYGHHR